MALYYFLSLAPVVDTRLFPAYLEANATVSSLVLRALNQDTSSTGTIIQSEKLSIAVRRGCDAIEPAWLLAAALLAFPAPLSRKASAILVGSMLLLALNIVRIVSLFFIKLHWPRMFDPAHLEIWPALFILVAAVLWVRWVRWVTTPIGLNPYGSA